MQALFIMSLLVAGLIWWFATYLIGHNPKSNIARVSGLFLICLAGYTLAESTSIHLKDLKNFNLLWDATQWTYILPIPLLYHFSVLVNTGENRKFNKYYIYLVYFISGIVYYILQFTNLIINHLNASYINGYGYLNPRGPVFWIVGLLVIISCIGSITNYVISLISQTTNKIKYLYGLTSSGMYLIIGPAIIYLYYIPNLTYRFQPISPILLLIAFLPILVGICKYRLISDVDYIFDWREFLYLSITMAVINTISGTLFVLFIVPHLGETAYLLMPLFLLITITTHGFYDWLATFIRDLLYNAGRGFALITDQDVTDWVRNFHNPGKLETNSLLKFKLVKQSAKNNHLVDAAQTITRDAIEYFKQPDFPRRTKQNLKYQILKMLTLDDADEGQILWELGFEGYPLKIMDGENHTRKPLFKVESMSDYTAISRNAFFALKKEAIHDLGWRLSYLERSTT